MTGTDKKPATLGFDDELDNLEQFTPKKKAKAVPRPNPKEVIAAAENAGFESREVRPKPKKEVKSKGRPPKKEKTDQINFRAKESVLADFRAIGEDQEPEWSLGYTLERAIAALKRELK